MHYLLILLVATDLTIGERDGEGRFDDGAGRYEGGEAYRVPIRSADTWQSEDDRATSDRVRNQLNQQYGDRAQHLSTDVNGGRVTLNGEVENTQDRDVLARSVRTLPGDQDLQNNLVVRQANGGRVNPYLRDRANNETDSLINDNIRDSLANSWLAGAAG